MTPLLRTRQWFLIALTINSRFPRLAHQALCALALASLLLPPHSLLFSCYMRIIFISEVYIPQLSFSTPSAPT